MAALTRGTARPVQIDQQHIGIAGADIEAGQACYEDATDGTFKLGDADAAGTSNVRGLALSDSQTGAALTLMRKGIFDLGTDTLADLSFGASVYLGSVAGEYDTTGVGQNVKIGEVVAGWASRPADKLLLIDL